MKQYIIVLLFAFIPVLVLSQNKIAKGYVLDDVTRAPIDSAIVAVYDTMIYTYTDVTGYFGIQVPKRRRHLDISHKDYETRRIILGPGFQQRDTKIALQSIKNIQKDDSTFYSYRNSLSLSILEFFHVAIGVRYEWFISKSHSVGAHCSFYINGRNPFNLGSEHDYYHEYQGFKLAPAYRYYPIRKKHVGVFLEGKIPFGYIDFTKLDYHSTHYTHLDIYKEYSTWVYGLSFALGVSFYLPKPKHGVITLSFGYQYFPFDVPEYASRTLSNGVTLMLPTDMDWWYFPGPGSYFEMKFMIGGIF